MKIRILLTNKLSCRTRDLWGALPQLRFEPAICQDPAAGLAVLYKSNSVAQSPTKDKLAAVLHYRLRHENVLGSGGIAQRILNLGTRWRWVISFTLRPLYSRKESPVPIGLEAGWASELVWTGGRREISLPCTCWGSNLDCPPRSLVAILTELPWLLERLTVAQLVQKFSAFYEIRSFIAVFTKAHHSNLSWGRCIQCKAAYLVSVSVSVSVRCNLMLSSQIAQSA
jgi:hypothetical protein